MKFTVSGWSKQAYIDRYTHTHILNALMLVWGLLRFAPNSVCTWVSIHWGTTSKHNHAYITLRQ